MEGEEEEDGQDESDDDDDGVGSQKLRAVPWALG